MICSLLSASAPIHNQDGVIWNLEIITNSIILRILLWNEVDSTTKNDPKSSERPFSFQAYHKLTIGIHSDGAIWFGKKLSDCSNT